MQKLIFGTVLALASTALCQQTIIPGPHSSAYNGYSRGFSFTSTQAFNITNLDLPLDAQQVGDTAAYLITINGTQVYHSYGNAGPVGVALPVAIGDIVRVVGNWSPVVPTNFTAHNSYTPGGGGSNTALIGCDPHVLYRAGHQWDIGDPLFGGTGFEGINGSMGRIIVTTDLSGGGCAQKENFGTGCLQTYNSFYEMFTPGSSQDLNGTAFSIIQTGSGSLTIPSTTAARGTATATNTNIGDDAEITFPFTMGTMSMPTPTGPVTSLTVLSNGMVSTDANTTSWTPNIGAFLTLPNTAWACHSDYRPYDGVSGSGGVYTEETATHFYVLWDAVESWGAPGPGNTFEYHFDKGTGNCELIIVSLDGLGGDYLVGHTVGGTSGDPGNTDLSALTAVTTSNPEQTALAISADSRPVLGTSVLMTLDNIPATSAVAGIIFSHGIVNPGVDLAGVGMPGCFQYANMHSVVLFPAPSGSVAASLNIPIMSGIVGLVVGVQGAAYVAGINLGDAIASNGTKLTLGN